MNKTKFKYTVFQSTVEIEAWKPIVPYEVIFFTIQ